MAVCSLVGHIWNSSVCRTFLGPAGGWHHHALILGGSSTATQSPVYVFLCISLVRAKELTEMKLPKVAQPGSSAGL